jgi:hypothetical protein
MKGDTFYHGMRKKEADYLVKLPDNVQYPAARCGMGPNVCMHGLSASSGVESMNRANKNGVRDSTAVDAVNGALRLVCLEALRYDKYMKLAWAHELPLTPKGMEVMESVFADVVPAHYTRDVQEMNTYYHCTVCRLQEEVLCTLLQFRRLNDLALSLVLVTVVFQNVMESLAVIWLYWLMRETFRTHCLRDCR